MQGLARQSGFSLIEALVAFLVLSIGILGALLFHSNLLQTSADNKAKLEALAFAETWAEDLRNQRFSSQTTFESFLNTTVSGAVVSAAGQLNNYGLSVSSVETVSGGSSVYAIEYQVYWPFSDPTNTLSLATYLGWLDPTSLIDPTETGATSGSDYDGSIPIPTGTLSEVPRIELASSSTVTGSLVDGRSTSTVKVYKAPGEQAKVAVQIDDNTYVQLAELTESDNEVFTITGRIYINTGDDYRVERGFGPVYGVTSSNLSSLLVEGEVDGDLVEGVDYYTYGTGEDARFFRNNVIDIRASAGANCLIGRYSNGEKVSVRVRGRDFDNVYYGRWADYICVAGTGWNGTIKPYFRNFDGDTLAEIVVGDQNCVPSVRGFRYFIIESEQPERLKDDFDDYAKWASKGVSSIDEILSTTSSSIVGQSGLVRFFDDATEYASSDESVNWSQYFWHNPNFLINPSHLSGASFAGTSSVVGPELYGNFHNRVISPVGYAADGYKSPKVTATTDLNWEMSLPGDVSHQNFYISSTGNGGGVLNGCGDVLDNMLPKLDSTETVDSVETPVYYDSGSNFTAHDHLADLGAPGYEENSAGSEPRGYIPPADSHTFVASDFNKEVVVGEPENTGVVILGYTLATESLSGTLSFPTLVSAGFSQFELGGGPSPVISITCNKDTNNAVTSGAYTYVDYSCSVPNYWTGEIFAYDSAQQTVSCLTLDYVTDTLVNDKDAVTEAEIASVGRPSVQYYYYQQIVSGAVAESQFAPLGFYEIASAAADLSQKDIYDFKFKFSDSTCPPDP